MCIIVHYGESWLLLFCGNFNIIIFLVVVVGAFLSFLFQGSGLIAIRIPLSSGKYSIGARTKNINKKSTEKKYKKYYQLHIDYTLTRNNIKLTPSHSSFAADIGGRRNFSAETYVDRGVYVFYIVYHNNL